MAGVTDMKVNMDSMRLQMSHALNRLAGELLIHIPGMNDDDQESLLDAFADLTIYMAGLICIYEEDDELFNDISDKIEVMDLAQRLEERHRS